MSDSHDDTPDPITDKPIEIRPPQAFTFDPGPLVSKPTAVWNAPDVSMDLSAGNAVTQIALVAILYLTCPVFCYTVLAILGVDTWYYGAAAIGQHPRMILWATVLAAPIQVVSIPLVLFAGCGTRPGQMGLTTRRLGLNLLFGIGVWVVVTPVVLGLHHLVQQIYQSAFQIIPEEHPLTRLAQQGGLTRWEWLLWISATVVTAPMVEELIFRGFLQSLSTRLRRGPEIAIGLAAVVAVLYRGQVILASWSQDITIKVESVTPLLFVFVLLAGLPLVRRLRPEMAVVWGTSAVFAMVHTAVWPTPVPLFVLALALGELYRRTGSLVGPIVVHSLFNGTSVVMFFIQVIPTK